MTIKVGKKWDRGAVYVGRPSPLGNPFAMKSEADRDRVCDAYDKLSSCASIYRDKLMSSICPICEKGTLGATQGTDKLNYSGKQIEVPGVEFSVCDNCHQEVVLPDQAKRNDVRFADAKRAAEGLLLGAEIHAVRKALVRKTTQDVLDSSKAPRYARGSGGMIFVFGSNLAGRHGRGAALHARQNYGAVYGVGVGRTGNAYAIPTKDGNLRVLPLALIQRSVRAFIDYAIAHANEEFEVTRIGCGLAGYNDTQIAPMFKDAPSNCHLPTGWRDLC